MYTNINIESRLKSHVNVLAGYMGERNTAVPHKLKQAEEYIYSSLATYGLNPCLEQYDCGGITVANIVAEAGTGSPDGAIMVIGAHYDTAVGSPGADDNASGIAVLLELARRTADAPTGCRIRFVAFANEEPPWFQSRYMGSRIHARGCTERGETVKGMVCLESLGYFTREAGSQSYPPLLKHLYPDKGDFVAFVGNWASRRLLKACTKAFRNSSPVLAFRVVAAPCIPEAGWSDHWSFWQERIPSVMVTDTVPFRNPFYHRAEDRPETLDYHTMALVADGLENVMHALKK